jgi:hypothetical protein
MCGKIGITVAARIYRGMATRRSQASRRRLAMSAREWP